MSSALRARVASMGNALARIFGIRGAFGVDFVLRDNTPWPVEVNPRYTAGFEILERAHGFSAFASYVFLFLYHAGMDAAAAQLSQNEAAPVTHDAGIIHGKAILYAKAPLVFPPDGPWRAACSWTSAMLPEFADVPHANSEIKKGQPIMTLFACATTEAECLDALRKKAAALDRRLFGQ